MANAAAKKTAAQNEKALQNLHVGMLASNALSILVRWWRRRGVFSLHFGAAFLCVVASYAAEALVYYFLSSSGRPSRDAAGNVRPPSVDLANPGFVCEWMFDLLYITWACQVGSALFGEYVWWLYLTIPGYIVYKVGPMAYGFLRPSSSPSDEAPLEPVSKRQQKLKARQDRGDSRVKSVSVKR
ncbi:hypothetical protein DFH11DRAFT_341836 [Phellopilus nigrolimitatus]|nr:hypothetical protein DFH11DRAFT_341836 [Phellopilus nigrolimitatus]